jgi:hypothetical protein
MFPPLCLCHNVRRASRSCFTVSSQWCETGSTGLMLELAFFFLSYERLMVDSAAYRWNRRACSLSSLLGGERRGGETDREEKL